MDDLMIELKLNPATGVWEANLGPGAKPEETSLSRSGFAEGINNFARTEFLGIPIGKALVGGVIAGVGDILIHFLEPIVGDLTAKVGGQMLTAGQRRALMMGIAAWAMQTNTVKNFVGGPAAEAGSFILAYEGLQNVFNARETVRNFAHGLKLGSHIPGGPTLGHEFDEPPQRRRIDRDNPRTDIGNYNLARARMTGV